MVFSKFKFGKNSFVSFHKPLNVSLKFCSWAKMSLRSVCLKLSFIFLEINFIFCATEDRPSIFWILNDHLFTHPYIYLYTNIRRFWFTFEDYVVQSLLMNDKILCWCSLSLIKTVDLIHNWRNAFAN